MPGYQDLSMGIACPMGNEIASARAFVEATLAAASRFPFKRVTFHAVFDKVCTDGSREALEELAQKETRLHVVYAPENRCVVDAYLRGYREALEAGDDWILEIDAGFSHDPGRIPAFIGKIPEGVDVVYATRFTLGGKIRDSSFRRRCISRAGSIAANLLLGTRLGDMTSGFILYSRPALEEVLRRGVQSRGPFFQTEMKYHARGMRHAEVPIIYTGASHNVGKKALDDARFHLLRLAKERFFGTR